MKKKLFLHCFFSLLFCSTILAQEAGQVQYLSPGIIAERDGEWIGSDHLYNLGRAVEVVVEIVESPEQKKVELSSAELTKAVRDIFEKADIKTDVESEPPLPFFHMLVMVQPLENAYVVYVDGRLFEAVKVDRVFMTKDAYLQAVTWEKQNLLIVPKDVFQKLVLENVVDIASQFVERFEFFEKLRFREATSS